MKLAWPKINSAWQPLTFRGVAAFAGAPLRRLLLAQFVFALLTAFVVVWFLNHAWFPTVRQAILQLPEQGQIISGRLDWTNEPPRLLAEGTFLAFNIDLDHTGEIRVPAHLQIELGRGNVRFISLLGFTDWPYSKTQPVDFNRIKLEPWWGAWRPPILWMVFGASLVGLLLMWWMLATFYFFPVWLIGFFANRKLNPAGSWKLAGAALLPGALLMILGMVAYGFGFLDPVQLLAVQALHWVVGWVYCAVSVFALPEVSEVGVPEKNPFQPERDGKSNKPVEKKSENPFQSPDK